MPRLIIQPDTEAARKQARDHAEDFMRRGGDHKKVIAEMRRNAMKKRTRGAR